MSMCCNCEVSIEVCWIKEAIFNSTIAPLLNLYKCQLNCLTACVQVKMFLHSFLFCGEHLFFTFSYIWNLELVEVGCLRNSCTMILPQKVGCLISILRAFWHAVMNDWHQSQRAKKDSACCDVSDLSWSKHGRCRLCTLMHISNCIIDCKCIVVMSLN